jgi:hypothetical protein
MVFLRPWELFIWSICLHKFSWHPSFRFSISAIRCNAKLQRKKIEGGSAEDPLTRYQLEYNVHWSKYATVRNMNSIYLMSMRRTHIFESRQWKDYLYFHTVYILFTGNSLYALRYLVFPYRRFISHHEHQWPTRINVLGRTHGSWEGAVHGQRVVNAVSFTRVTILIQIMSFPIHLPRLTFVQSFDIRGEFQERNCMYNDCKNIVSNSDCMMSNDLIVLIMKEEAQDRTLWRTQFGRGYWPVARQTNTWLEWCGGTEEHEKSQSG